MENREPALAVRVAQVQVEVGEAGARHQALVDDSPARARRQVHRHAFFLRSRLCAPAREIQAALPLVRIEIGFGDEAVPDGRPGAECALAQASRVDGDRTPGDQLKSSARHCVGDDPARPLVPLEQDGHRDLAAEQAVRHLDQEAGAISALAVGVEAAAMGEAGEGLSAERYGFVAEVGGGHKAHSTGCPVRG